MVAHRPSCAQVRQRALPRDALRDRLPALLLGPPARWRWPPLLLPPFPPPFPPPLLPPLPFLPRLLPAF
jgi:hypothetical protein